MTIERGPGIERPYLELLLLRRYHAELCMEQAQIFPDRSATFEMAVSMGGLWGEAPG